MPHIAMALAPAASGWQAWDVDLAEVEDLDGAIELLRETAEPATAVVMFVEEDDEWFGILRVVGDDEPRVFLSDRRVTVTSALAGRIFADALAPPAPEEDADDESSRPEIEPAGDADLLEDLGTTGDRLIELTAEEGMLPGDVIAALSEAAGAIDAVEELRGA